MFKSSNQDCFDLDAMASNQDYTSFSGAGTNRFPPSTPQPESGSEQAPQNTPSPLRKARRSMNLREAYQEAGRSNYDYTAASTGVRNSISGAITISHPETVSPTQISYGVDIDHYMWNDYALPLQTQYTGFNAEQLPSSFAKRDDETEFSSIYRQQTNGPTPSDSVGPRTPPNTSGQEPLAVLKDDEEHFYYVPTGLQQTFHNLDYSNVTSNNPERLTSDDSNTPTASAADLPHPEFANGNESFSELPYNYQSTTGSSTMLGPGQFDGIGTNIELPNTRYNNPANAEVGTENLPSEIVPVNQDAPNNAEPGVNTAAQNLDSFSHLQQGVEGSLVSPAAGNIETNTNADPSTLRIPEVTHTTEIPGQNANQPTRTTPRHKQFGRGTVELTKKFRHVTEENPLQQNDNAATRTYYTSLEEAQEDAKAYLAHEPSDIEPDNTIPQTMEEKRAVIFSWFLAMMKAKDQGQAKAKYVLVGRESEQFNAERAKPENLVSPQETELKLWTLLDCVIYVSTKGRLTNGGFEHTDSCATRIDKIEHALSVCGAACNQVLEPSKLQQLAEMPDYRLRSVNQNKKNNDERAKKGKGPEGDEQKVPDALSSGQGSPQAADGEGAQPGADQPGVQTNQEQRTQGDGDTHLVQDASRLATQQSLATSAPTTGRKKNGTRKPKNTPAQPGIRGGNGSSKPRQARKPSKQTTSRSANTTRDTEQNQEDVHSAVGAAPYFPPASAPISNHINQLQSGDQYPVQMPGGSSHSTGPEYPQADGLPGPDQNANQFSGQTWEGRPRPIATMPQEYSRAHGLPGPDQNANQFSGQTWGGSVPDAAFTTFPYQRAPESQQIGSMTQPMNSSQNNTRGFNTGSRNFAPAQPFSENLGYPGSNDPMTTNVGFHGAPTYGGQFPDSATSASMGGTESQIYPPGSSVRHGQGSSMSPRTANRQQSPWQTGTPPTSLGKRYRDDEDYDAGREKRLCSETNHF